MNDSLQHTQTELLAWRDKAIAEGWLPAGAAEGLNLDLAADPAQLFDGVDQRPLVVAFFGGTGVGKSSLINRLAGQSVARTGAIRPTSREVTVYAHASLSLARLPDQIPTEKVRVSSHMDTSMSQVVWIDTPDVDSVATEHRDQVLAWLPYIDVVIYVVSPERYRDDAGWRMLREAGDQHAWLFVLNQWDRGRPEQWDDFHAVLDQAGFADPKVFRTVCTGEEVDDDFAALRSTVEQLGEHSSVAELVEQAESAQSTRLRAAAADGVLALGPDSAVAEVEVAIDASFARRAKQIGEDLAWQIKTTGQQYAEEDGGWRQLLSGKRKVRIGKEESEFAAVWSERSDQHVEDALAEIGVRAAQLELPHEPLREALASVSAKTTDVVATQQRAALVKAIAKPGKLLHRWLFNTVAAVAAIMPLLTLGWIGYRVVGSFYTGNEAGGSYLGGNFAINSLLLLGVTWLLPALLREKIRPSLSAAVERGLEASVDASVGELAHQAKDALQDFDTQRKAQAASANQLVAQLPQQAKGQNSALSSLRPQQK